MVRRRRFDERLITGISYEFEQLSYQMRRGNIGIRIENNPDYPQLNERRFKAMFGCTSTVCANAWLIVVDGWRDRPTGATKVQFLWALHLLKSYDTEINLASNVGGVDEKTLRYWTWYFLEALADRKEEIVSCLVLRILLLLQLMFIFIIDLFLTYIILFLLSSYQ